MDRRHNSNVHRDERVLKKGENQEIRAEAWTAMELEEFKRVHGILLASAGLPSSLYSQLHSKLSGEVFDGGQFFEVEAVEEGRERRLVLLEESLKKESQVFLVDHAWSFRLADARKQLETIPGLADRMGALMCVVDQPEAAVDDAADETKETAGKVDILIKGAKSKAQEKGGDVLWLELDDLDIGDTELQALNLSANFPNLVGLSLWGNKLESLDVLVGVVGGLSSLRALWLNKTAVDIKLGEVMKEAVIQVLPKLEIYNSQFTRNYTQWAIAFCAGLCGPENPKLEPSLSSQPLKDITDLDLSDRNIQKLCVEVFKTAQLPFLSTLNLKGNPLEDDSTTTLVQILKALISLQSLLINIPGPMGNSALEIVDSIPNLQSLNRVPVAVLVDKGKEVLDSDLKPRLPIWSPEEPLVDRVMQTMWQYVMTYRLADEEKLDETPIWYVMDELGSALRHSDAPNFRAAPFMYLPDGTLNSAVSYSLLWPIQDMKKGEECTRDYLVGLGEDRQRSARLTAWFYTPKDYFIQAFQVHKGRLRKRDLDKPAFECGSPTSSILADGRPLAVYSDIPFVLDFLRRPEFVLVEEPKEADIIWTSSQIDEDVIKNAGIEAHQYINQFPFESCLVMKHHLAQTMQQAYGSIAWLPQTYDMETQLPSLIGDYLERESHHQNNLWIVKPWNMARTMDTTVTSSLPALIRLVETGPKIAQKYIDRPALFEGRKFDLRYIILLRSLRPLEVYICDVFWARFSNNQYTTEESSLSEYETHFTVMNYKGKMNHINTHDFVPAFEKEHNVNWKEIHERVKSTIRQVFEGAASVHPEMHSPRGRAMYGVDVMLDNAFQPKLLEVTYCPDCARACKYDVKKVVGDGTLMLGKDFINCVFGALFLNEDRNVQRL